MRERKAGIIMNGVTGRMGLNQHLIRSILAIRKQGGLALADGSVLMPDPILVGRNEEKLKVIAAAHGLTRWSTDLARCSRQQARHHLFRLRLDRNPRTERAAGNRRRQARLLRKAALDHDGKRHQTRQGRGESGRKGRRRAGQAFSARHSQAATPHRLRLLRAHPHRARRVRLLGLRGRLANRAAPIVELPKRRRRRNHSRHVLSLALCARPHLWPGPGSQLHRRNAYSRARRRGRARPTSAQPTTLPMACSS